MNTIEGNVKLIGETVTFNSGFTKRQIVITTDEMYPQDLGVDFVKDDTTKLDSFKAGQNVVIDINIKGREHEGRHFVNLQGWRIKLAENQPQGTTESEDDDLPF